jgi:hypothetical protein
LAAFEKIVRTPMPLAYSAHLQHCLYVYILALPFQLVYDMGWWTIPTLGLASFAILGILGIGAEIENPFGYDDNDLVRTGTKSYRTCNILVDIAAALNVPLFDLAENLAECSPYHREQFHNWSKIGRSLGLTCGGQRTEPSCASVKEEGGKREGERALHEGGFLSIHSHGFA